MHPYGEQDEKAILHQRELETLREEQRPFIVLTYTVAAVLMAAIVTCGVVYETEDPPTPEERCIAKQGDSAAACLRALREYE